MPHWKEVGDSGGSSVATTPWSEDFLLAVNADEAIADKLAAGATGSQLFAATTASAARTIVGGPLVAVFDAAGQTIGSTYGLDGHGLTLYEGADFKRAATYARSGSEYGRAWRNPTNLSSVVSASNELTLTHTTANDDLTPAGSVNTQPEYYFSFLYFGKPFFYAARVRNSATAGVSFGGIYVANTADIVGTFAKWGVGNLTSANTYRFVGNFAAVGAPTSPSLTIGGDYWIAVSASGESKGLWYNLSSSATLPRSGWVLLQSTSSMTWIGTTLEIGIFASNPVGSATFTTTFSWLKLLERTRGGISTGEPLWGGQSFDTTGVSQCLGVVDLGAADAVVSNPDLQEALAASVNLRTEDAATVTFSAVRHATAPTAGSFAAAGSATVSGTGRMLGLFAKIASSDGLIPGSIKLPIAIPVS